jgi:hypothetical protein
MTEAKRASVCSAELESIRKGCMTDCDSTSCTCARMTTQELQISAAVFAEREACKKVCDEIAEIYKQQGAHQHAAAARACLYGIDRRSNEQAHPAGVERGAAGS